MSKTISYATALLVALVLTIPQGAFAQGFGGALATSGGDVFVGHTANTNESGIIHVYRQTNGTWEEVSKLQAADADGNDDRFGRALLVLDGQLFSGATTKDDLTGRVYIFEQEPRTKTWGQVGTLVPEGLVENDTYGRSIASTNGQVLVGAAGTDSSSGAVYVFQKDGSGQWKESAMLRPDSLRPNDLFGLNVAANSNGLVLVTEFRQGGPERFAQIRAYRYANGSWIEEGLLETGVHTAQSVFGLSVAMTANRAFVSAPNHDSKGAVFLFRHDDGAKSWTYDGILTASDDDDQIAFGSSVSVQGDKLYVGAQGANDGSGKIYVYSTSVKSGSPASETIELDGKLHGLGSVLLATSDRIISGSPGADFGLGRAGILSKDGDGQWKLDFETYPPVESMAAVRGEQVRCEEGDAAGFGCEKVDLLSFMPVSELGGGRGVRTNDVWGWTDPETGREYALVGRMDGTAFVDISDPYNPMLVGSLPMTKGSQANAWRDIKVYKDHAYVVADGAGDHGMQVFDLRQLRGVTDAPVTFTETAHYDKIASAHNIVINEDTGFAYTVGNSSGGETCGGGSHMIDIRDPQHPKFAGCFAHVGTGRAGTGYTHDAQCVVYHGPDKRFVDREICFGSNETALSIADVTDKDSTVALASATYPNVGYAHQGWLTEDHRYFLLDDELDEISGNTDGTRTLIWDVTDLEDPQLIKEYVSEVKSSDHNLYIKGNLVYQSNYVSGLRILDISDIMNPVEVGNFDTVPGDTNDPGFDGSWSNYPFFKSGVIVVTSGAEGLFLVKKPDIGL